MDYINGLKSTVLRKHLWISNQLIEVRVGNSWHFLRPWGWFTAQCLLDSSAPALTQFVINYATFAYRVCSLFADKASLNHAKYINNKLKVDWNNIDLIYRLTNFSSSFFLWFLWASRNKNLCKSSASSERDSDVTAVRQLLVSVIPIETLISRRSKMSCVFISYAVKLTSGEFSWQTIRENESEIARRRRSRSWGAKSLI